MDDWYVYYLLYKEKEVKLTEQLEIERMIEAAKKAGRHRIICDILNRIGNFFINLSNLLRKKWKLTASY